MSSKPVEKLLSISDYKNLMSDFYTKMPNFPFRVGGKFSKYELGIIFLILFLLTMTVFPIIPYLNLITGIALLPFAVYFSTGFLVNLLELQKIKTLGLKKNLTSPTWILLDETVPLYSLLWKKVQKELNVKQLETFVVLLENDTGSIQDLIETCKALEPV